MVLVSDWMFLGQLTEVKRRVKVLNWGLENLIDIYKLLQIDYDILTFTQFNFCDWIFGFLNL